MPRGESEIKDLVEEIEHPFRNPPSNAGEKVLALRDRMQAFDEYVFNRRDYAKDLSPLLTTKISIAPALLRFYVQQGRAALADGLKLHLEPLGSLKREDTAADKMEVFEAHALLQLDPYGFLRDDMHDAQVRSFFFAAWMEMEKYIVPEQAKGEGNREYADRVERYRKAWWPYRLSRKPQTAVAFYEDDNRRLTIGVCRYKISYADLLERYGEAKRDNPEQMSRIFSEHFAYLPLGSASNELYAHDLTRNEVEVCALTTGDVNEHWIDMGQFKDKTRETGYKSLEETKNPFGQPCLLLAEGVFNGDQPTAYRREPLLTSLILIEDQKAIIKSNWASAAANPPQLYEHKVPPEIAVLGDQMPPPLTTALMVNDAGRPIVQRSYGELTNVANEIQAQQDKLYQELSAEGRIANPGGLLFDPDAANRLDTMPATTVLKDSDERLRMLAGAKRSETTFWGRALDMIECAMRNEQNKHRTKGEPKSSNDWVYGFTSSGKEGVKGRAVKRGDQYEITPQELDYDYTRTIETVDNRISTRMAMLDVAERRWMAGTITYDERLEMSGVENISAFKETKTRENLYQLESVRTVMATRMRVAQFLQAMMGTPMDQTLATVPEQVMPQIVGGEGQAPVSGGGMHMSPPSTDQMGVGGPQVGT